MSLELALQTHLLSKTSLTALIGHRCWIAVTDPIEADLPDVTIEVNAIFEPTHDGLGEDLQFPEIVLTCRGTMPGVTYGVAGLVRRALRDLIHRTTIETTAGPVVIEHCEILGQHDSDARFRRDGSQRVVYQRELLIRLGFRFDLTPVT